MRREANVRSYVRCVFIVLVVIPIVPKYKNSKHDDEVDTGTPALPVVAWFINDDTLRVRTLSDVQCGALFRAI